VGVCAFSGSLRGSKLVPVKWHYLVPPVSLSQRRLSVPCSLYVASASTTVKRYKERNMNILKNLFNKEPPTEGDMLNYAAGEITLPYSGDAIRVSLHKKYPDASREEVNLLEEKCSKIFEFCMDACYSDDLYVEHVRNQHPFLSKSVVNCLRGKAFVIQERGVSKY
jgi:hypothetical protein